MQLALAPRHEQDLDGYPFRKRRQQAITTNTTSTSFCDSPVFLPALAMLVSLPATLAVGAINPPQNLLRRLRLNRIS